MNKRMTKLIASALLALDMTMALPVAAADNRAGGIAFDNNSCGSCHAASTSTIGPSLKDIAKRYKGKPVAAELAQRIRAGSEGRWGGPAHPAYEGLDPADALLIATWILGGAAR